MEGVLEEAGLNTVCHGAKCPNRGECFASGTATFMIMGAVCTRSCRFCAVPGGTAEPLRDDEPQAVAGAASAMGLNHVVITSVTRDDLPDGGAAHFARTVEAVRRSMPGATIEVLVPDFGGDVGSVDTVLEAGPDVFNHNVETVARLYGEVRPQADYPRTLGVLRRAAQAGAVTKSGFMVGLNESRSEVSGLLSDLVAAGCVLVTSGQYLRPSADNLPVARYWEPREFEELQREALGMGFEGAACAPLVRSSYEAGKILTSARKQGAGRERDKDPDKEMARR